jgi:thymidylate synthase (FAD)
MKTSKAQKQELQEARAQSHKTKRPTVTALEKILHEPIPVLDHGFIRVVDYMGDDAAIVQAARVSYGIGTKKVSEDAGLIRYLRRHLHTTPSEMCEIKFHVKLPIFVARQWIRHRTANVNEYSARYSILDKEFYLPKPEHLAAQSVTNRQGRGAMLSRSESAKVLKLLRADAESAYDDYAYLLNDDGAGKPKDKKRSMLARELARMNLSLNYYTQWYWKIDLHNLFHFLRLRADAHAQYEIRVYADVMLDIVKKWVPHSYEAFEEYQLYAFNLSRTMKQVVRRMIGGEQVTQETSGMSKREWAEFVAGLGLTT